jgi:hypothetical protein
VVRLLLCVTTRPSAAEAGHARRADEGFVRLDGKA